MFDITPDTGLLGDDRTQNVLRDTLFAAKFHPLFGGLKPRFTAEKRS